MGSRPDYNLPSVIDFEQNTYQNFAELEELLYRVECNINHYKLAINRVVSKKSPNVKHEQYRDSLLWEVINECAREQEVHFITNDNDFFQDRQPSKGLANNLKSEIQKHNVSISIYQKLDDFLSKNNKTISHPNYDELSILIDKAIIYEVKQQIDRDLWDLHKLKQYEIKAFLTEKKETLALSFIMTYSVSNTIQSNEVAISDANLVVEGDSIYSLTEKTVLEIELEGINYYNFNGERLRGGIQFLRGGLGMGVRDIPYRLRQELTIK